MILKCKFKTQLIVMTERRRERDSSIFFRTRAERKKMLGLKGLKEPLP
jgi:hypothetical protein